MTTAALKKEYEKLGITLWYGTQDTGHGEQRGWWADRHFIGQRDAIDYDLDTRKEKNS